MSFSTMARFMRLAKETASTLIPVNLTTHAALETNGAKFW